MSPRNAAARTATLRRLARTLDLQGDRLRAADLAAIAPLVPQIDRLCATLEAAGAAPDDAPPGPEDADLLACLRDGAARNLRLTQAALQGLRDASRLLEAARAPDPGSVYGPDGARTAMGLPSRQLERRS